MRVYTQLAKWMIILALSVWVGLLIWTHEPFGYTLTSILVFIWGIFTYLYLLSWQNLDWFNKLVGKFVTPQKMQTGFFAIFTLALIAFFGLTPSNNRHWQPEVSHLLDYSIATDGKSVTLENVRNFDWQTPTNYTEHWETRAYDLEKLQSLDFIASYWMGKPIAHTLVSFGFSDGKRVAFSIEIRKENGEEFSALGGFFRNYELTIVAADEKDIIYTRSNARHEDVYIYPLKIDKNELKQLFMAYLRQAKALQTKPQWYNTLTKNCTTEIYRLQNQNKPSNEKLPLDYRILASGYSPNYLYDINAIDHKYTFDEWRKKAYINPKSDKFSSQNPISSKAYSALIRKDF